jgi:hypothetical protein
MASNYTYFVPEQNSWADRNPRTKADAALDKLDAAGVKNVVLRAMASEADIAAAEQFHKDEQTFRVMYPAYRDTTPNARAMKLYWEESLGVTIPSLEQIEESFFALRGREVLQLDAKAVAKENQEAILRRAAEIREKREAEAFNEADAYTMPLEELERRARGF